MSFDALAESCKSLLAMPTVCPNTGSIPAVSGTSVDVDKPPSFQFVSVSPKIERKPLAVPLMFGGPNITGEFVASAYVPVGTQNGAFRVGKIVDCPNKDNNGGHLFYFDASDSDSTYGATQTVQPPSIRLVQCIKL